MAAKKKISKKHNKSTGRDYDSEYKNYHSSEKAKKQRARNNKANRDAGTYGNGDGKDIAHTKPGAKGKTYKQSPSKNRSFKRTSTARRKK